MMSERQRPTDRRAGLAALAATLLVLGACAGNHRSIDEDVTWKQADAVLKSPEIATVHELFLRLSDHDIEQETKSFYADTPAREAEFWPLDEYIAHYYLQSEDIGDGKSVGTNSESVAARHRLERIIHWKTTKP